MRIAIATAVVILVIVAAAWFAFVNPLNLGVPTSEHFTAAKFDAVRPGARIGDVIRELGRPLRVTKNTGFPGVCPPAECDTYAFTGSPAPWVIGHKEAWLVVDRQGRVVHKVWNVEP
jgi:hypothetical protein